MDFLLVIGRTVGKIFEYTIEPVARQMGYALYYSKNIKKLRNEVGDLVDARERVQHAVEIEERRGKRIEADVQNWLTKVNEITEQTNEFLGDEQHAEIKCLHSFCPNIKLRHQLSRKSTKFIHDVAELHEKQDFSTFAYEVSPQEVCSIPTKDIEVFASRISVVKDIMDELRNSNIGMIGVYGIGGVGKTTLVKEVYRQATEDEKLFDEVILVLDVKQNPSIHRIQVEIAEKLGLNLHENETMAGRARRLCNRIKDKKTLVLLDDVWEHIDLEAVGLPCMATLKILLTSRSKIVLSSDMGTQKEFLLQVLDKEETWTLFQKMAGDIVKRPNIQTVATQVAEKCGGLPLLIVTVARALKNSMLPAWKDALRRLKVLDGQELTDKAYSAIEWSYTKLDHEELKSLFLLCASVLGHGNRFNIIYLLKYSMGLGLIKNVNTIEEAQDSLHSLLEKLKDSCLLLENNDDSTCIRMHDLVQDVAKRIASRDQYFLSARGNEFKEWPDKDFCEKCTLISLKYCTISQFPEVLPCRELTMFLLSNSTEDSSREIPCNFFKEMKKLRVLDITNLSISLLPSSLQFLKNLRTLCLDQCTLTDLALVGELENLEILSFLKSKFKELPNEIGKLTCLRLLNLTGCSQLEVISPNVLSSLKRLEHLRMGDSFNRWEAEGVIHTERSNANLEELKQLRQLTTLQLHIPDASILPIDLFTSKLERFQICIGSAWKWADVNETLNALKLQLTSSKELDKGLRMLLKRTEDLYLEGMDGVYNNIFDQLGTEGCQQLKHLHVQKNAEFAYIINGKVGFLNLTWLAVSELNGLRFLFSSSMARSLGQLKRLQISGCQIMEEIVKIQESDEDIVVNMFCKLQDLELKDLPNLTKFCSRSSSSQETMSCFLFEEKDGFPSLKSLYIIGLSRLTTIWHNQLGQDSFCKLEVLTVHGCGSLINIFSASIMGRLNALETLSVKECKSLQVVFEGEGIIDQISASTDQTFDCENLDSLEIDSCESLKNIFSVSVARNLQNLKRLIVVRCGVEEIVAKEEGIQTALEFVFSKVTYGRFKDLPRLMSFYPGMHVSIWPTLVTLVVQKCGNVEVLAEEVSAFQEKRESNRSHGQITQSLFLIEKDSFPSLEMLILDGMEIWNGQVPVKLFSKLKYLEVARLQSESAVFLDKLLLDLEGNTSIGTQLSDLTHLRLIRIYKLMHLGENNSQTARSNLLNVEILLVDGCGSLRNLRSSLISFKNLTTLQVSLCKGLEYLITYSMAKSLVQLTKLEVEKCQKLVEIVGSIQDDVDDDLCNEITFRRLTHLKLSHLPRLRGFCSRNCSVKFPSLETLSMRKPHKLKIFRGGETLLSNPRARSGTALLL